jgi:phosphatidylglycerophosphate synthase
MKQLPGGVKRAVRRVMYSVARALNGISGGRVTPNGVTWVGFLMHVPIALLIAKGEFVWGAILLAIFGLFDTLDGELARLQKRVSDNGGFLDATTDRLKEVLLYSSVAWYFAQGVHPQYAALAAAACGASICVSFVKAKGEAIVASSGKQIPYPELNRMFSGGLFPFEVRMLVLLVGLLVDQLVWAVVAVALFSTVTAFQRLFVISRRIS